VALGAALAVAAPVWAQPATAAQARAQLLAELEQDAQELLRDRCAMIGSVAQIVMQARQDGASELETFDLLAPFEPGFVTDVIEEAFLIPRFRAPDDQSFIIEQFRTIYEISCYQAELPQ
jgi:hypothetical protein